MTLKTSIYSLFPSNTPLQQYYNIMEKWAFSLVKSIKDIRVYILHSHTIAYVPNVVVKDNLTQDNSDGRRGK